MAPTKQKNSQRKKAQKKNGNRVSGSIGHLNHFPRDRHRKVADVLGRKIVYSREPHPHHPGANNLPKPKQGHAMPYCYSMKGKARIGFRSLSVLSPEKRSQLEERLLFLQARGNVPEAYFWKHWNTFEKMSEREILSLAFVLRTFEFPKKELIGDYKALQRIKLKKKDLERFLDEGINWSFFKEFKTDAERIALANLLKRKVVYSSTPKKKIRMFIDWASKVSVDDLVMVLRTSTTKKGILAEKEANSKVDALEFVRKNYSGVDVDQVIGLGKLGTKNAERLGLYQKMHHAYKEHFLRSMIFPGNPKRNALLFARSINRIRKILVRYEEFVTEAMVDDISRDILIRLRTAFGKKEMENFFSGIREAAEKRGINWQSFRKILGSRLVEAGWMPERVVSVIGLSREEHSEMMSYVGKPLGMVRLRAKSFLNVVSPKSSPLNFEFFLDKSASSVLNLLLHKSLKDSNKAPDAVKIKEYMDVLGVGLGNEADYLDLLVQESRKFDHASLDQMIGISHFMKRNGVEAVESSYEKWKRLNFESSNPRDDFFELLTLFEQKAERFWKESLKQRVISGKKREPNSGTRTRLETKIMDLFLSKSKKLKLTVSEMKSILAEKGTKGFAPMDVRNGRAFDKATYLSNYFGFPVGGRALVYRAIKQYGYETVGVAVGLGSERGIMIRKENLPYLIDAIGRFGLKTEVLERKKDAKKETIYRPAKKIKLIENDGAKRLGKVFDLVSKYKKEEPSPTKKGETLFHSKIDDLDFIEFLDFYRQLAEFLAGKNQCAHDVAKAVLDFGVYKGFSNLFFKTSFKGGHSPIIDILIQAKKKNKTKEFVAELKKKVAERKQETKTTWKDFKILIGDIAIKDL